MTTTLKSELTCLNENHKNAEITLNANQERIDDMMHLRILDRDTTAEPGSPTNGDTYLIKATATGTDWTGHDDELGFYHTATGWTFLAPFEGMELYIQDEDLTIVYDGTNWHAKTGQQTLADGANIAWNGSLGIAAQVTLGGDRTMDAPTLLILGQVYVLHVIQDGTGTRLLTWDAAFNFPGGTPPTLSVGVNDHDVIMFVATAAGTMYMLAFEADMS